MPTDPALPDAVVFDCDGTLVDTESISDATFREVLGRRGYEPTADDFAAILGRPHHETLRYWEERLGGIDDVAAFEAEEHEVFQRLFDEELVVFDDAVGVLRELHARGIPVAVASSSGRGHVERVLEVCGITACVTAVFGAGDTDDHKPHPAPYLAAVGALGADPATSAAVEDTRVGVASATAAGLWTVAVRRGHVPEAHLAEAHVVTDRLELSHLVRQG